MGYDITIGNAVPKFIKEDGELLAWWDVEGATSDQAPTFINDEMTGNSNSRSPSYCAWTDFTKDVGLHPMFYGEWDGLMRQHPGCFPITMVDLLVVQSALEKRKAISTREPGFSGWNNDEDEEKYDYNLARLMWLEFWMRWALENCETPAIQNR